MSSMKDLTPEARARIIAECQRQGIPLTWEEADEAPAQPVRAPAPRSPVVRTTRTATTPRRAATPPPAAVATPAPQAAPQPEAPQIEMLRAPLLVISSRTFRRMVIAAWCLAGLSGLLALTVHPKPVQAPAILPMPPRYHAHRR
jgi:hypothetical protein